VYFYLDVEIENGDVSGVPVDYLTAHLRYLDIAQGDMDALVKRYRTLACHPFGERECRYLCNFYCSVVWEFIKSQSLPTNEIMVMGSCRADKFSLHIVNKGTVFDRVGLSLRYFVWELCRYTWKTINECLLVELQAVGVDTIQDGLIRILMLEKQFDGKGWRGFNDTGIDEVVYKRNQLFRLLGSTKGGGTQPLYAVPLKVPSAQVSIGEVEDDFLFLA
jgi:hypothetical protein